MWPVNLEQIAQKIASFTRDKQIRLQSIMQEFMQADIFARIDSAVHAKHCNPIQKVDTFTSMGKPKNVKIATLIFAGGQGSRLQASMPKALIEIFPGVTLLQMLIERCIGPVFIMCSQENFSMIQQYIDAKTFSQRVHAFVQTHYPFFESEGIFFFANEELVLVPAGNGEALFDLAKHHFFYESFDLLSVCNVDNPFWNPTDDRFLQYHLAQNNEVTIACCPIPKGKKMGIICTDKPYIMEYCHAQLESEKKLFGNMGAYLLSKEFCEQAIRANKPKLYPIKKTIFTNIEGYKLESFFFDQFLLAKRVGFLGFDPQAFFPIKEKVDLEDLQVLLKSQ